MVIEEATQVTDELVDALERLLPQLKFSFHLPSLDEIEALVSSNSSRLLYARYPDEDSAITGILTLIVYRVPTGTRARIEDVIVDEAERQKGIGEALIRRALKLAREAGADGVSLSSNPRREAANSLYRKMGFNLWKTNLYFFTF